MKDYNPRYFPAAPVYGFISVKGRGEWLIIRILKNGEMLAISYDNPDVMEYFYPEPNSK